MTDVTASFVITVTRARDADKQMRCHMRHALLVRKKVGVAKRKQQQKVTGTLSTITCSSLKKSLLVAIFIVFDLWHTSSGNAGVSTRSIFALH